MALQSTFFDPVLGLDTHILGVPTPVVPLPGIPTPFPMPFVGMVFDPIGIAVGAAIGALMGGGPGVVLVNGLPVTNCGTNVTNKLTMPHVPIPPGAVFIPPPIPGDDAELQFGSLHVSIGGSLGVRLGDIALSCNDPVRLPTSAVVAIPKGMPVLNQPAMVPDLASIAAALVMKGAMKALGALAKKGAVIFRRWQQGSNFWKKLSNKLGGCHAPNGASRWRGMWSRGVRFVTGHPVDVVTGNLFTDVVDAELPGPIPLVIERVYESAGAARSGVLGHGWSHSLDESFWLERGRAVVRLGDGREVELPLWDLDGRTLREGDAVYLATERLTLRYQGELRASVEHRDGTVHEFAPVPGGAAGVARLTKIRSRDRRHAIELRYDAQGRLEWVRDTGGRLMRFVHDAQGRLSSLKMPLPDERGWYTHRRYFYDEHDDLVEVVDSLGALYRYRYQGHLLVQETDRVGLSFYFQYDGTGSIANCIRTWGDGGIFDHVIHYDPRNRKTTVEDSLGAVTVYEYNVRNQVTSVRDARGGATRFDYDPATGARVLEIDPMAGATRRTVDVRGNVLSVTDACEATTALEYNERDQIVAVTTAVGARWRFHYDAAGRLTGRTDPLGASSRCEHEDGLVCAVVGPRGETTELFYDEHNALIKARNPLGGDETYTYDERGRLIAVCDPRGSVWRWRFDLEDRCVEAELPTGEGLTWAFDAEGNVTEYVDALGNVTRFRYGGFHKLAEEIHPTGTRVRYRYDTEDRLTGLLNELEEAYHIELDPLGRVTREVGFDGRALRFRYDRAGRCVEATNGAGRITRLERDAMGRVTQQLMPGVPGAKPAAPDEVRYAYDADGALVYAKNRDAEVTFERDLLGRVVRERVNGHAVESAYDASGNRVARRTSHGHAARYRVDALGLLRGVTVDDPAQPATMAWWVALERDVTGAEVARRLPGDVAATWAYDASGRPSSQRVTLGLERALQRDYAWRGDEQIASITDAQRGATRFVHDARSHLVAAQRRDGSVQHRQPDAAGNLFRTPDRSDRVYGRGGVLREADGARFVHDAEGQLVERVSPDGRRWRYAWDGAGQLREVMRPDGGVVSFGYDPLGRRVRKTFEGRTTGYVWDGDDVVHELRAAGATTWVFEPGAFAPLAKLEDGRCYGVVSDHLGAPVELRDEVGRLAWRGEFDLYGAVETDVARTACPWRWPGQYEDEETGLYYNRFRYYDPGMGRYLSEDPARLLGGLNLNAYVADPLGQVDVFGLEPQMKNPFNVFFSQNDWGKKFGDGSSVSEMVGRLRGDPSYARSIEPVRLVRFADLPPRIQARLGEHSHPHAVFSLDNRRLFAAREARTPIATRWATQQDLSEINLDKRFSTTNGGKAGKCR